MSEEKILIIAVKNQTTKDDHFQSSLQELISLANTAGGTVQKVITQNRSRIHGATYIGEGKVEEVKQHVEELEIDIVIANDELSPGQLRNLSTYFNVRVIDRSQLILDIFARRAKTKEGKLQVELAQLEYLLPRLAGQGVELSRLGGGIGTRGPGETKLETDRRHIRNRIVEIKRRLKLVVRQREQYRKRRKENKAFQIAIVGYTNAGKSTMFNRLTNSDSLEENQLFATLDPLTRKIQFPSGFEGLITDTVGFIQDLPTSLIAAFRSTLEEVHEADFLIHVVDASDDNQVEQQKTVMKLLEELDAHTIPMLTVYNKKDLIESEFFPVQHPNILISAYELDDLQMMLREMEKLIAQEWDNYSIQLNDGHLIARLERETIIEEKYFDENSNQFVIHGYIRSDHPLNQVTKPHK